MTLIYGVCGGLGLAGCSNPHSPGQKDVEISAQPALPLPTQLWWVHQPCIVNWKLRWWERGLATRHGMPRLS